MDTLGNNEKVIANDIKNRLEENYTIDQILLKAITNPSGRKIAQHTVRANNVSPFEIILSDVRRGISNDACNRMKSMYTSDPRRNMTNAVWVITTYIELKNGLCQIRFEIKNGNPSE